MKLTKEEAIQNLVDARGKMDKAETKADVIDILQEAGAAVGYKPTMRCLVMGKAPDLSIKWG